MSASVAPPAETTLLGAHRNRVAEAGGASPNRAARRSPAFRVAVDDVERFALDALEGENDFNRAIARVVLERVAHGLPQRVSTAHLLERARRRGVGGGRHWTRGPSYGSVVRLLEKLKAIGVLTWERCNYDRERGKSPPRVLQLIGEAKRLARAALTATWIPAVLRPRIGSVPRKAVPPVPSALEAESPSATRPPGEGSTGTPPLDLAPLKGWIERN